MEVYELSRVRNTPREKLPSLKLLYCPAYYTLNKVERLFLMSFHKWHPFIFGGMLRDYYTHDCFPPRERVEGDVDVVLGCQYLASKEDFEVAMEEHLQLILGSTDTRFSRNKYEGLRCQLALPSEEEKSLPFDVWSLKMSQFYTPELIKRINGGNPFRPIAPQEVLVTGASFTCEAICYDVFAQIVYCRNDYFKDLESFIDFNNEEDYALVRRVVDELLAGGDYARFTYGESKRDLNRAKKLYDKLVRYRMNGFELIVPKRIDVLTNDWQKVYRILEENNL